MNEKFKVSWQAYDGYVGGRRPQSFTLDAGQITADMTDDELDALLQEETVNEFMQKVTYSIDNEEAAIEWLKAQRDRLLQEEESE